MTVIVNGVAAEDWPNVSLTVTMTTIEACDVGVPATMPVAAASESPSAGSPVALQVSVPVPEAWKVKPYAVPAVAGAAVTCACVVVIVGAGGLLTVIVSVPVVCDSAPAELESFMVTVNETVFCDVGVPVMAPVLALIERPSLRPVALQVSVPDPPVAVNEKLYATPAVAGAAVNSACVVVMLGWAFTVMVTLLLMLVFLIEVAVIVAVPVVPLALNCTEVIVTFASAVQAAPVHVQVTPSPPSFAAVTLIVMLWPRSTARADPPGKESVTPELPPQLARMTADIKMRQVETQFAKRFMAFPRGRCARSLVNWREFGYGL